MAAAEEDSLANGMSEMQLLDTFQAECEEAKITLTDFAVLQSQPTLPATTYVPPFTSTTAEMGIPEDIRKKLHLRPKDSSSPKGSKVSKRLSKNAPSSSKSSSNSCEHITSKNGKATIPKGSQKPTAHALHRAMQGLQFDPSASIASRPPGLYYPTVGQLENATMLTPKKLERPHNIEDMTAEQCEEELAEFVEEILCSPEWFHHTYEMEGFKHEHFLAPQVEQPAREVPTFRERYEHVDKDEPDKVYGQPWCVDARGAVLGDDPSAGTNNQEGQGKPTAMPDGGPTPTPSRPNPPARLRAEAYLRLKAQYPGASHVGGQPFRFLDVPLHLQERILKIALVDQVECQHLMPYHYHANKVTTSLSGKRSKPCTNIMIALAGRASETLTICRTLLYTHHRYHFTSTRTFIRFLYAIGPANLTRLDFTANILVSPCFFSTLYNNGNGIELGWIQRFSPDLRAAMTGAGGIESAEVRKLWEAIETAAALVGELEVEEGLVREGEGDAGEVTLPELDLPGAGLGDVGEWLEGVPGPRGEVVPAEFVGLGIGAGMEGRVVDMAAVVAPLDLVGIMERKNSPKGKGKGGGGRGGYGLWSFFPEGEGRVVGLGDFEGVAGPVESEGGSESSWDEEDDYTFCYMMDEDDKLWREWDGR